MKQVEHIEFRTECEAPTKAGWYWVRRRGYRDIIPTRVSLAPKGGLHVWWLGHPSGFFFDGGAEAAYYGSVTMVQESKVKT